MKHHLIEAMKKAAEGLICAVLMMVILCVGVTINANASVVSEEYISNGDFETGSFAGWTVQNSGPGGWAINNGAIDPPGPGGRLDPISDSSDAMTYQQGPGQYILQQTIELPINIDSATLSWSDRIRNYGGDFRDIYPYQEWKVLIKDSSGDLIQEVFSTNPGDNPQEFDPPNYREFPLPYLANYEGQQIRVSFEQQCSTPYFNVTLDNVSLVIETLPPAGDEYIANGRFETGNFAGWTVQNSGSGIWAINNGGIDPPGQSTPLPPIWDGFDAMTYQQGSGQYILQQTIELPTNIASATLSWWDRIRNYGGPFSDPNQEWRVLIKDLSGALNEKIFSTKPTDPMQQVGPNYREFDLTGLAQDYEGLEIQVSFEQQCSTSYFNVTLDNVSLVIETIPNSPPSVTCPPPVTEECSGTSATLVASVADDNGDALTVIWEVNGTLIQTDPVPAGGPPTSADVTLIFDFALGSNAVAVTVDDGIATPVSCTSTVTIVDTMLPVITLNGDNPMTLECPTIYAEPGATVTDVCDPAPSLDITGTVDCLTPGTYTVTYTASDASGNTAEATRTVNVVDTTPPVITLVGDDPQVIECCSAYVELGAIANDTCEGDLTGVIIIDATAVDTYTPGSYMVTYDVSDTAGNAATQVTRTVNVVDTTLPVITLVGDDPQVIECCSAYVELGATANDTCEGDLTGVIIIDATAVDTCTPGSYMVTYDVSDTAGNAATQVTRTVDVIDTMPPVITLNGDNPMTLECPAVYAEPGATVTDVCDPAPSLGITGTVDCSAPGTYTVTYTASDASGNTAVAARTVNVADTTPPVVIITEPMNGDMFLTTDTIDIIFDVNDNCDMNPVIVVTPADPILPPLSVGDLTIMVEATDASGNVGMASITVTVNQPPNVSANLSSITVDEGLSAENAGTVIDPDGDIVILSVSVGTIVNNDDGTWSWSFPTSDGPSETQVVTITADDGNGGASQTSFELVVNNVNPTIGEVSVAIDPVQLGTPISANATFTDPAGTSDESYSYAVDYGDNTGAQGGTVEGSTCIGPDHIYGEPGVYTVSVTVRDKDGGIGTAAGTDYIVVYDLDGGFVTGGGWINSPAGAYIEDGEPTDVTGKANFGFVSKYKKGATTPTGQTEFQFKVADLNFHSSIYEWLVVAGANAKFMGEGTVNGSGNYGFMLTAADGDLKEDDEAEVDGFRIKIWNMGSGSGVIYDNGLGANDDSYEVQSIDGGSIVIHGDKPGGGKPASAAPALLVGVTSFSLPFPQPANPEVWIPYQLGSDSNVVIRIYDVPGRLVRTLDLGHQTPGRYVSKEKAAHWDGSNEAGERVASGIYFYNIQAGDYTAIKKLIIAK